MKLVESKADVPFLMELVWVCVPVVSAGLQTTPLLSGFTLLPPMTRTHQGRSSAPVMSAGLQSPRCLVGLEGWLTPLRVVPAHEALDGMNGSWGSAGMWGGRSPSPCLCTVMGLRLPHGKSMYCLLCSPQQGSQTSQGSSRALQALELS